MHDIDAGEKILDNFKTKNFQQKIQIKFQDLNQHLHQENNKLKNPSFNCMKMKKIMKKIIND